MKGNTEECHFITSTNKTHQNFVRNSSSEISSCEKLLRVKTDSKLTFDE